MRAAAAALKHCPRRRGSLGRALPRALRWDGLRLEATAGDLRQSPYRARLEALQALFRKLGGNIVVAETARGAGNFTPCCSTYAQNASRLDTYAVTVFGRIRWNCSQIPAHIAGDCEKVLMVVLRMRSATSLDFQCVVRATLPMGEPHNRSVGSPNAAPVQSYRRSRQARRQS